jgi:hypothetical protein
MAEISVSVYGILKEDEQNSVYECVTLLAHCQGKRTVQRLYIKCVCVCVCVCVWRLNLTILFACTSDFVTWGPKSSTPANPKPKPKPSAILVICKKEIEGGDNMELVQMGSGWNECQCHFTVAVLYLESVIAQRWTKATSCRLHHHANGCTLTAVSSLIISCKQQSWGSDEICNKLLPACLPVDVPANESLKPSFNLRIVNKYSVSYTVQFSDYHSGCCANDGLVWGLITLFRVKSVRCADGRKRATYTASIHYKRWIRTHRPQRYKHLKMHDWRIQKIRSGWIKISKCSTRACISNVSKKTRWEETTGCRCRWVDKIKNYLK